MSLLQLASHTVNFLPCPPAAGMHCPSLRHSDGLSEIRGNSLQVSDAVQISTVCRFSIGISNAVFTAVIELSLRGDPLPPVLPSVMQRIIKLAELQLGLGNYSLPTYFHKSFPPFSAFWDRLFLLDLQYKRSNKETPPYSLF